MMKHLKEKTLGMWENLYKFSILVGEGIAAFAEVGVASCNGWAYGTVSFWEGETSAELGRTMALKSAPTALCLAHVSKAPPPPKHCH